MTSRTPTVLGIRSPWSGDERDKTTWTYWVWVWAYTVTRRWRHLIGLHDFEFIPALGHDRCTWCGINRSR